MGKILAICTSPKRGTVKTEVPSAVLTPEWGIVSDAHGGNWHRQVSLLSAEKIEAFRKKIWVDYGAFGENLVIEGFDFRSLPVTSRFAIGDVVLEMTQIGKECHNDCVIKQQTGECIMPREGVFARVLKGGEIRVGDEVTLLPPLEDPPLRAAVITLSDKGSRGEREDKSGPLIVEMLTAAGYKVEETMILPDEAKALKAQLIQLADGRQVNLILTTGGTGSPAQTVKLGSESWQVLSACKPHDCGHERIAVIWSEKSKQMSGVYSVVDEKTDQEKLTWLNVSDALSIDGKTVLFAALSGSLDNHPDAFNYQ